LLSAKHLRQSHQIIHRRFQLIILHYSDSPSGTITVQLSLFMPYVHTGVEGADIPPAPLILNLCARWRWQVNITPRSINSREINSVRIL